MARLTPRDIQEKEFSTGFRGYKEEDVDEFLDRLTGSYEELFKENIDLKEETDRLIEENKKYELIGERMQSALVAAQETADDVRKNATKEAENTVREAEIKAHKMVQESRDQHRELQKSLAIVKQIEEEFRFKLKSTLQSYLKLLDEMAIGENKEVKQWILPEDMAALGERRREMEEQEAAGRRPSQTPEPEAKPAISAAETGAGKPELTAEDTAAKEAEIEDSKAKTAALLDQIAKQAAKEEKEEKPADATGRVKDEEVKKPAVEAAPAKVEETKPPEMKAEEPKKAIKEPETAKTAGVEETGKEPPFDAEAGKASAVSSEWNKLQAAVDEAVKETGKPKAEAKPAAAEKKEETKAQAKTEESIAKTGDTGKALPKAKIESKEAKSGKSNLEDIEIIEDESFWKDI